MVRCRGRGWDGMGWEQQELRVQVGTLRSTVGGTLGRVRRHYSTLLSTKVRDGNEIGRWADFAWQGPSQVR